MAISYGVRTAQVAVSQLMDLDIPHVKERKPSILALLRILLLKWFWLIWPHIGPV